MRIGQLEQQVAGVKSCKGERLASPGCAKVGRHVQKDRNLHVDVMSAK